MNKREFEEFRDNFNYTREYVKPKENNKDNKIQHQDYYTLPNGVECIDVAKYFNFNIGNVIKYLWRHGKKHESGMADKAKAIEDLNKAIVYIQKEIEMLNE